MRSRPVRAVLVLTPEYNPPDSRSWLADFAGIGSSTIAQIFPARQDRFVALQGAQRRNTTVRVRACLDGTKHALAISNCSNDSSSRLDPDALARVHANAAAETARTHAGGCRNGSPGRPS